VDCQRLNQQSVHFVFLRRFKFSDVYPVSTISFDIGFGDSLRADSKTDSIGYFASAFASGKRDRTG